MLRQGLHRGLRRSAEAVARIPVGSWERVRVLLLVSTGRTGTRQLARTFAQLVGDRVSRHEPTPDLFHLGRRCVVGALADSDAARELRRYRQRICNELWLTGSRQYVESNNNLAYLVNAVRYVFPDCRIVHVVRDGRDVVRSLYSKRVHSKIPGRHALFMTDADARERLRAADLPWDSYATRWHGLSRFEQLCWYWMRKDELIVRAIRDDCNAITVRFENLFGSETEQVASVQRVLEFSGLHVGSASVSGILRASNGERLNETAEHLLPPWPQWSPALTEQFWSIAGDQMRLQGYAAER